MILSAAASLLQERGLRALNVRAIMHRAGVSRTAFYRQFRDVTHVVRTLVDDLVRETAAHAAAWYVDDDAVGSPDVIYDNAREAGRRYAPHARLMVALAGAAGTDESTRRLWRDGFIQSRIDATEAAIRRDQAAGAIRPDLDPAATARALNLMSEQLLLEVLGREGGTPEDYADAIAPIWRAVLFGPDA